MASAISTVSPYSLDGTLPHAIRFLTRALRLVYQPQLIEKFQVYLLINLAKQFESSWVPAEPRRGSGRRCLTFSPAHDIPPRSVYSACKAVGVDWSKWIACLGGIEFDLFIDPGEVTVRSRHPLTGQVTELIVWKAETVTVQKVKMEISEHYLQAQLRAQAQARAFGTQVTMSPPKTVAQQLIEEDDYDDEVLAMIPDEVCKLPYSTPTKAEFPVAPVPQRATSSPVSVRSTTSTHSRSSSRSSNSSSGLSLFSIESADSYGSATTISLSPDDEKPKSKLSRRERARQARVFIDKSKTEVTNYDGGKTTVLTGGVMLGGAAPVKAKAAPSSSALKKTNNSSSSNWRSIRV